jgi:hypothetical protein
LGSGDRRYSIRIGKAIMRNIAIVVLSAFTLLPPAFAFAGGGGPVSPPAVGAANPAPPAVGEVGVPPTAKPSLDAAGSTVGSSGTNAAAPPTIHGADTSTAAPGGQAESSKNGALSTPPDVTKATKHHKKSEPAAGG